MTNTPTENAVRLLRELISFDSTSRFSNQDISQYLGSQLRTLGFDVELSSYKDAKGVEKFNVAGKLGSGNGGLAYFCHSDVVPADDWQRDHGPFLLTEERGLLYGRGSCDMKGSTVCMLQTLSTIATNSLTAPVYFVCTADEEIGFGGARDFVQKSSLYREMVDHQTKVLIGEPTGLDVVHAHKGIVALQVVSHGRSAHSSSDAGINANLAMIPFLVRMKEIRELTLTESRWQHDEFDPPHVSWNIGINDFTYASNITPGKSVCTVFYRPMPDRDATELLQLVESAAHQCGLELRQEARGEPFYTNADSPFVKASLKLAGRELAKTVSYGTDGGELTAIDDLIVFGPGSIAQAHTADEWIAIEQIEKGIKAFGRFVRHFCTSQD